MGLIDIEVLEKEFERLKEERDEILQRITNLDERIHYYNIEKEKLCEERIPLTEKYQKLHQEVRTVEKALEYLKKSF